MTWGLSFILALTAVLMRPPILDGGMTYYTDGLTMRNGQPLDLAAATCAVSGDRWEELQGAQLLVCTDGPSAGCEPGQRRKQNDLPKVVSVTAAAVATANSGARPCEAISDGKVLPSSRLESCAARTRCVHCVVSDSGDAEEFAYHGVVIDVTPALARLLMGRLGVGRVDVRVWELRR